MKKIIAAAVAAAFVAPVWAADVTLSGDLEMRWTQEDGEGLAASNNDGDITVTASEELANGWAVSAKIGVEDAQDSESGAAAGNTGIAGDVELSISGPFGTVAMGEIDAAVNQVDELASPGDILGTTGAGNVATPGAVAPINSVAWTLPAMVDGLTVVLSAGHEGLTSDEASANERQVTSYGVRYAVGGLTVATGTIEADDETYDGSYVGASYTMNGLTVGMDSATNDGADNTDTQTLSAAYNMGDTTVFVESNETDTAAAAATTDTIVGLTHVVGGGLSVRFENLSSDTANTDSNALAVIYAF